MSERDWPLKFEIRKKCSKTKARAGILTLPHHTIKTPVFMPVGTNGTIKGITTEELIEMDIEIILGNTYHLGTRPGVDVIKSAGGLHKFMNWPRNILTDSGGFQMVSLSKLSSVSEEGVTFTHPCDGSKCLLTPEKSMQIQMGLGSDIIMQLDDVISSTTTGPRVKEAMLRSIRWLQRCINEIPNKSKHNLFPIIQGGLDHQLRTKCITEMTKFHAPGFAIGGLSGGEAKTEFYQTVNLCTDLLPLDKPRYLMGVGYTIDLIICTAMGCDMYDCVFPTRTARFGHALTVYGSIDLKLSKYGQDFDFLDPTCTCLACTRYTRSHLHNLITSGNIVGQQLITLHNLLYQKNLMNSLRTAIMDDELVNAIDSMLRKWYIDKKIDDSVIQALELSNVKLESSIF